MDTQIAINDKITFYINSRKIKIYKFLKFLYMNVVVWIFCGTLLIDKTKYSDNMKKIIYIYIILEMIYILIYADKLVKCKNNFRLLNPIIGILRVFWFLINWLFIFIIFNEKNTGFLYYFSMFVAIVNLAYLLFIIMCIPCITRYCDCFTFDYENKNTYLYILDDSIDLRLFKNIIRTGGYHEIACPICYENYNDDEKLRVLDCKHYFHINCIDEWLCHNSSCPICRINVN